MTLHLNDPSAVILRCISSVNTAVDWIGERDLVEAAALLNFVIDDLEQLALSILEMREPDFWPGLDSRGSTTDDLQE